MAMIACSECGAAVSTDAKACPGCGAKPAAFNRAGRRARRKGCIWALVGFFILSAIIGSILQPKTTPPSPEQVAVDKAAEDQARERSQNARAAAQALKNSLRDPDSAVFESISTDEAGSTICIQYRARNGFGGMNRDSVVFFKGDPDASAGGWNSRCANRRLFDETDAARRLR